MSTLPVALNDSADGWRRGFQMLLGIAAVLILIGIPFASDRLIPLVLIASLYLLGLALGSMMFLACDALIEGGWTALFRRVPEAMSQLLLPAGIGIAIMLLAAPVLYPWIAEPPSGGTVTALKSAWLSRPFFTLRAILYFAVWIGLARAWVAHSRQQDLDGDVRHTHWLLGRSAGLLVAYALTIWLASVDWVMSLEPAWFSTMIGVYQFAGIFLSALASVTLVVIWLGTIGPLRGFITANHYHDLGKLLFSFGCFWFYIWYSQYLIIWYANIPEETLWYLPQFEGAWGSLFLANLLLNWAVPFFLLLPGQAKRDPRILGWVATAVLLGRWIDLSLMIGPATGQSGQVFGLLELGGFLGTLGIAGWVLIGALGQAPLVPRHDPYLQESLHHHV